MDKVLVLQVVVREQSTCEKSLGFSHGDELDLLQVVHRCCRWTRTHRSRCKRCWAKVSITVRLPSWHQCVFILAGGPRQGLRGAGGAGQRYRLQSGCHLGINVFLYPCRWTRTKRLRCRWCWRRASSTLASATCSVRCCTPTPAASAASGAACPLSPVTNPDVSAAEL